MGARTLLVQRKDGNGNWFPIQLAGHVLPSEPLRLFYGGFGPGAYVLDLKIISGLNGATVWGPVRDTIFIGDGNQLLLAPNDSSLASYVAILEIVSTPWPFQDKTPLTFPFFVDPNAPPPPQDGGGDDGGDGNGGGFFGNWKTLLIIGGIVVAVVALSPTINRGAGYLIPRKD